MTFNLSAAESFLLRNYDSTTNLVREAPNAARDNFWVWNDTQLAAYALSDHLLISGTLQAQLDSYKLQPCRPATLGGLTMSQADVLRPTKTIQLSRLNTKVILTEQPDPTQAMFNLKDYADVAFYYVVNYYNIGYGPGALYYLQWLENPAPNGAGLWDGYGWRDKSWNGLYQLYKNALYLLACNALAYEGKYRQQNETAIGRAQVFNRQGYANQQGGVLTEYLPNGTPTGDCNVETAALCTLALRYRT